MTEMDMCALFDTSGLVCFKSQNVLHAISHKFVCGCGCACACA